MSKPWENEPDEKSWTEPTTGYSCEIKRVGELGHLCGYVDIEAGHPFFGMHYDNELIAPKSLVASKFEDWAYYAVKCHWFTPPEPLVSIGVGSMLSVHGGVTYSASNGEKWRFGFDCAHSGDLVPSIKALSAGIMASGVYRDIEYVTAETEALAVQLAALAEQPS